MANLSRLLIFVLGLVLSIAAFQNCSKVGFKAAATTDPQNSPQGSLGDSPGSEAGDDGVVTGPTPLPPGFFDPADVEKTPCKSYKTLQYVEGQHLEIPARDPNSGICFALKLMDAIAPLVKSSTFANVDTDVIARSHDTGSRNPDMTRNPFIMGKASLSVLLKGERSILLAGAADDKTKITVDNFILIGVNPENKIGDPDNYRGYGSKDSAVAGGSEIIFKNERIPLVPFATGGVSTIEPLAISTAMELNKNYFLDIRALDCGNVGGMSDLYLVFQ